MVQGEVVTISSPIILRYVSSSEVPKSVKFSLMVNHSKGGGIKCARTNLPHVFNGDGVTCQLESSF